MTSTKIAEKHVHLSSGLTRWKWTEFGNDMGESSALHRFVL